MGYYITLTDSDWIIPNTDEVLQALKEMPTKYHALKRGGSTSGESWFSWMNDKAIEDAASPKEIFNLLGFETEDVENGFKLYGYDNKTGQEDLFLAVVSKFCEDGSYAEWRGEDGNLWKQEVREGRMFICEGEVVFTHATPFRPYRFHSGTRDGEFFFETQYFDGLDDPAMAGPSEYDKYNKELKNA
jgi:hypothetical protein